MLRRTMLTLFVLIVSLPPVSAETPVRFSDYSSRRRIDSFFKNNPLAQRQLKETVTALKEPPSLIKDTSRFDLDGDNFVTNRDLLLAFAIRARDQLWLVAQRLSPSLGFKWSISSPRDIDLTAVEFGGFTHALNRKPSTPELLPLKLAFFDAYHEYVRCRAVLTTSLISIDYLVHAERRRTLKKYDTGRSTAPELIVDDCSNTKTFSLYAEGVSVWLNEIRQNNDADKSLVDESKKMSRELNHELSLISRDLPYSHPHTYSNTNLAKYGLKGTWAAGVRDDHLVDVSLIQSLINDHFDLTPLTDVTFPPETIDTVADFLKSTFPLGRHAFSSKTTDPLPLSNTDKTSEYDWSSDQNIDSKADQNIVLTHFEYYIDEYYKLSLNEADETMSQTQFDTLWHEFFKSSEYRKLMNGMSFTSSVQRYFRLIGYLNAEAGNHLDLNRDGSVDRQDGDLARLLFP